MPRRSLSEPARTFGLRRPPRRGEVYWVSFGPAVGGEIQKTRPPVVVRLHGEPRKAMADQLTTASRKQLVGYLGKLGAGDMEQVDRAIRLQLALS